MVIAATGVITSFAAGCQKSSATTERTCTGTQAISTTNLHGGSLPMKTISLTFDDGPGPRTGELSSYLKAEGIRAAFFVNGKMIGTNTSVLQQIVADGHVLANHTQTHVSLTGRATGSPPLASQDVVAEVAQTDALIAPFVTNRFLFRAPYGDFDEQSGQALEASPMKKYVGPINWEIGDHMGPNQAADWDCWSEGADGIVLTPQQCGDLYVKEIDGVGNGIVLMHDPYFIDNDPAKGGTVDMVKLLVPALKAKGYKFVRVDEVPEIAALLPAAPPDGSSGSSGQGSSGTTTDTSPTDPADDTSASGGNPDPCRPSPQQNNTK